MNGKAKDALTPKQQRFVDEYVIDMNATAAYRRAGYISKTDNAAAVGGNRLLTNSKVQAALAVKQASLAKKTGITQEYVLRRLQEEADATGEGTSHAARIRALELLGKHLGMFAEKVEHTGKEGRPIEFIEYAGNAQ